MTIRLRLTALYGGLFLLSGAALLAITYVLVAHQYNRGFFVSTGAPAFGESVKVTAVQGGPLTVAGTPAVVGGQRVIVGPTKEQLRTQAAAQSRAAVHQLLVDSVIALAIMAVLSIWLGWIVAGRALRPLRTITNAAREISATNLHRRLALAGPNDEIKQLGTTFDRLLERLEAAFDAQRRFVANASHELRTPLTFERTLVEVALADPDADAESLRKACEQVLVVGEQQERLIESLLTLSRSQRGLDGREPVDLAVVAGDLLEGIGDEGLTIDATLEPAPTSGDPRLLERLVANLLDNAIRYNVPHGRIAVSTATDHGRAVLRVGNSGALILPHQVERLFQPFQRLGDDRVAANGSGLGLSIVQAIATAHGASLIARPEPDGGLFVEVDFPASESPGAHHAPEQPHAEEARDDEPDDGDHVHAEHLWAAR